MSLILTSSAFDYDGNIPAIYTCDGDDISPELTWSGIPANAKSLVLIVDDPDAPDPKAPKRTLAKERFIARHMMIARMSPLEPSRAPAVTSSLLSTTNPSAAAERPA